MEYRICWSASSNINFGGATDWAEWVDDGDPDDVLNEGEVAGAPVNLPAGLDIVIGASGFEWWVETRDAS